MLLVFLFFVSSIIADGVLFSAMKEQEPDLYEKLGSPGLFSLSMNPLVIVKYWLFILNPNSLPAGCGLGPLLWFSRICFLGFIGSIVGSIVW